MEFFLVLWLSGQPVAEIGPVGDPETCEIMRGEIASKAATEPGGVLLIDGSVYQLEDLSSSCHPASADFCPFPGNPPEFAI